MRGKKLQLQEEKLSGKSDLTSYLIGGIIIMLMFLSQIYFVRLDLTSEKRYTLSPVTKATLKNMPDQAFIRVYLDGDLPPEFVKMRNSIREMLDEFRVYAGDRIQYQFVNPMAGKTPQVRKNMMQELVNKGLQVTNIQATDEEGGKSEKYLFPGAIITYKNTEVPINLLQNNPGLSAEENLNNSLQLIEYRLISTLHTLASDTVKKVAFIEGHGEFDQYQTADISKELSIFFQIDRGKINGVAGCLDQYVAVIIAGPTQRFSEADKFVLDQYLMQGGKILFFIDGARISLDSLHESASVALINDVNLDDQLFRYGVRINPNLIQDIQCALIPVNIAVEGQSPRFAPFPWYYFPLLTPRQDHPVTRTINLVRAEFVSSIDTLAASGLKKTILLTTSSYTKVTNLPNYVSLEQVRNTPRKEEFNRQNLAVAVMIEGNFPSVFRNRMLDGLGIKGSYQFRPSGQSGAIVVVSDADIIRNDVRFDARGPLISPAGFDRYTNQIFGNREFVVNTLNYLTDASGIIQLRNKEFRLRVLDRNKVRNERTKWQLINTLLPSLIIVTAGILQHFVRRRKYGISRTQ